MATLVRNHGKMPYCNPLLNVNSIYQGTQKLNSQIGIKNLLSVIITLSKTSNIGFKMYLDVEQGLWKFDTYTGIDRSVAQTALAPIIFSDEYGNLTGASYICDNQKYKNYALVLGEGEWPNRVQVEVDVASYSSEPRRYMVVDAKDLRKEDDISDTDYRNLLYQRGLDKLSEQTFVESFDADAATSVQWEYRKDWNLGDIVTIESLKWGISVDKRVTEVEEIMEGGVYKVIPTFGTPLPENLNLTDLN